MEHPAPHDRFMNSVLSHQEAAEDLVRCFMPPGLPPAKPGSIKPEPGTYIDERLRGSFSDAVFSFELENQPGLIHCLVEHQSTAPPMMALRTSRYSASILEDWVKANPGAVTIPAVIPIVIYQGARKWTAPTQLLDLTSFSTEVKERLRFCALSGGYWLVNLKEVDLEEVRCGLILRLGLNLMQAVIKGRQMDWLETHGKELSALLQHPNGELILRTMISYISWTETRRINPSTLQEIAAKVVDEQIKREIMTLAEAIQEEGRKEGRLEGAEEGLRRGVLIGRIQSCQASLGRRQDPTEELVAVPLENLEAKLEALWGEIAKQRN